MSKTLNKIHGINTVPFSHSIFKTAACFIRGCLELKSHRDLNFKWTNVEFKAHCAIELAMLTMPNLTEVTIHKCI